jgi:hypothetical protein
MTVEDLLSVIEQQNAEIERLNKLLANIEEILRSRFDKTHDTIVWGDYKGDPANY